MYNNLKRIFSLDVEPHYIRVIDGVKLMMFGWFMVGETAIFGITVTEIWTTREESQYRILV
jgi:hypothetical protein